MCVALPGIVIEIDGRDAIVDFSGNKVLTDCGFVPVKVGDHVLVHAGCILQTVSREEYEELNEIFRLLDEEVHGMEGSADVV